MYNIILFIKPYKTLLLLNSGRWYKNIEKTKLSKSIIMLHSIYYTIKVL